MQVNAGECDIKWADKISCNIKVYVKWEDSLSFGSN